MPVECQRETCWHRAHATQKHRVRHVGTDDVVGHRRSGAEERSVCFDAVSARRRAVVEHCAGETRPAFYRGRGGGGHGGEGGGAGGSGFDFIPL